MSTEMKGYMLGFIGVVFFGITLPVMRLAVTELDPVFVGVARVLPASVLAAIILLVVRPPFPAKSQWLGLSVITLGNVVFYPLFTAIAMKHAPASHGGVVLGIMPLATTVAGVLFGRERPSLGFWICGVLGAVSVVAYALLDGTGPVHIADGLLALSVVSASVGYAFGATLTRTLGAWQVICWAVLLSVPLALPVAFLTAPVDFGSVSSTAWAAFLYIGIFSQLIAFFAWNAGLALGGIARVGQVQLLQTFVTLAVAALLLDETIDGLTILFALIIMVIVAASRKMRVDDLLSRSAEKHESGR